MKKTKIDAHMVKYFGILKFWSYDFDHCKRLINSVKWKSSLLSPTDAILGAGLSGAFEIPSIGQFKLQPEELVQTWRFLVEFQLFFWYRVN